MPGFVLQKFGDSVALFKEKCFGVFATGPPHLVKPPTRRKMQRPNVEAAVRVQTAMPAFDKASVIPIRPAAV